jgi:hypothetical protein
MDKKWDIGSDPKAHLGQLGGGQTQIRHLIHHSQHRCRIRTPAAEAGAGRNAFVHRNMVLVTEAGVLLKELEGLHDQIRIINRNRWLAHMKLHLRCGAHFYSVTPLNKTKTRF